MKRITALFVLGLLLTGCVRAQPEPALQQQPGEQVAPAPVAVAPAPVGREPIDAPMVTKVGNAVRVKGLDSYFGEWAWSPDGTQIAFRAGGSIWSIRPDGSGLAALVRSSGELELLGWIDRGPVCIERVMDRQTVKVGEREYEIPSIWTPKGYMGYRLLGRRILLLMDGLPAAVVNLDTLETRAIPGWEAAQYEEGQMLRGSRDMRYVAFSARDEKGAATLYLLDMEGISLLPVTAGWAAPPLIAWSDDNRWAAASAAKSDGEHFTLTLHVGTPDGQVRALPPPPPLGLTMPYPHWSPDGTRVALSADESLGTQPAPVRRQGIWVVDTRSGQWTKVGTRTWDDLVGWADDTHLLFHETGGGVTISVPDGQVQRVPLTKKATAAEGTGSVYAEFQPDRTWTVFRQRPGAERERLQDGLGPANRLEVRGRYLALDPWNDLVIIDMD